MRRTRPERLYARSLTDSDRAMLRSILRKEMKLTGHYDDWPEYWSSRMKQLYRIFMSVAARPRKDFDIEHCAWCHRTKSGRLVEGEKDEEA